MRAARRSQRLMVLDHLIKYRRITAAEARRKKISRLPAYIERLRKSGYKISTVFRPGQSIYVLES